jgi:hypothetical protein
VSAWSTDGAPFQVPRDGRRVGLDGREPDGGVASWPDARRFGLCADMIDQAFEFKEHLDKIAADPPANF